MCTKQVVYKSLPMMKANLVRSDKNIYIRNDQYFQLRVYIERLKPWREALIDAETRQQRFKFFVSSTLRLCPMYTHFNTKDLYPGNDLEVSVCMYRICRIPYTLQRSIGDELGQIEINAEQADGRFGELYTCLLHYHISIP